MQTTAKPQGLAKIWREVKRPFRKGRKNVDRGVRKLYYPLLHWAYKKAAKKHEIILSEPEATETIVRDALKIPEFFKACVTEAVVRDALKSPEIFKACVTEAIVRDALKMPEIFKACVTETIVRDALKTPEIFKACVTETIVRDALKTPEIFKACVTETVVRDALKMPEIFKACVTETIVRDALKTPEIFKACVTETIVRDALKMPETFKACVTAGVVRDALKMPGMTESIIPNAINSPAFIEKLFDKKAGGGPSKTIQNTWDVFFSTTTNPSELQELQDRLVADTDELSREVVARYIARRRFYREYGPNNVLWGAASKLFGLLYPLDYKDQQRIKVLGEAYRCPYKVPNDYSVGHMALGFGFHDFPPEIQKKVIGKDIIDGGGLSGDSAMLFTEYGPKKVYTFEANPDSIPGMEKVLSENAEALGDRKDKIEIVPIALGRSKGTLTLFSRFEFDGAATILPCDYETRAYEVPMISIDEFVEKHALVVGLIKLDIEGAEWDTLLGARTTIQKQKPLLLISIYHTFRDFFEIKPLLESWGMGYKFAIRDHYPAFPDAEIMLVAYCEE